MIYRPTNQSLQAEIQLPSSKSISNRVLIIQCLSKESFEISNVSDANDTLVLQNALKEIRRSNTPLYIDMQDAGTPFRFLTSLLCVQEGKEFILGGDTRLCERPIQELVEALRSLGADILYTNVSGCAPLRIRGQKLKGGSVQINAKQSSQFISSLCLLAPTLEQGLEIIIKDALVSESYVTMTLNLMALFGISYQYTPNKIYIPSQGYQAHNITIENDWSAASFFYMMAMMHSDAQIHLQGLDEESLQGDSYVKDLCVDFGIESLFDQSGCLIRKVRSVPSDFNQRYSMNSYPDLAIPFIVACALCYHSVQITGIEHLEFKESKRITALQTELRKIGIELVYKNDVLTFSGTPMDVKQESVFFNTYHDHRIAMSLSMLAIFGYKIVLDDTQCVKKSFPNFFHEISKMGFVVE